MPSLQDYFLNKKLKPPKGEVRSHFCDKQWVHPKLAWHEGTRMLKELFPKDTRPERPKAWYAALRSSHWPDMVPPGNGPFYISDGALSAAGEDEADALRERLKSSGFKLRDASAAIVPSTGEYLLAAMRAAGKWAWNMDPVLYQAYWYPGITGKRDDLRPYNTIRWRAEGMEGP